DGELALPVRDPAPGLALARLPRDDLDLVGDHEGGIEADAELADEGHVLARVARKVLHEGGGARARDRAEILDQLVMAHADAVVDEGQGARRLVRSDGDAEAAALADEAGLGQRGIAQAVAGIGSVRDELAQED